LASLRQDHTVLDPGVAGSDGDWEQDRRARKGPGASGWATGQVRGTGGVLLAAPSPQHPPSFAETAPLLLNPQQSWVCCPHPPQGWVTGMGGWCLQGPWAVSSHRALAPSWGQPGKTSSGMEREGCKTSWWFWGFHVLSRASIGEGCSEL